MKTCAGLMELVGRAINSLNHVRGGGGARRQLKTFTDSGFEPLESRIMLASQIISVEPIIPIGLADQQVAIDVDYNAINDAMEQDNTLAGLGLRMHFDSSQLTLTNNDISNVLQNDLILFNVQSDTNDDFDGDPSTDMFLNIAWADIFSQPTSSWPAVDLPVTLYTATFTATGAFSETLINFTLATAGQENQPDTDGDTTPVGTVFELDAPSVLVASPLAADVIDVTPDPRGGGVNSIDITFDREVDGVDISDFTLTRDGGSDLLAGAGNLSVTTNDNVTFTVSGQGLFDLTDQDGVYLFSLISSGSGITDNGDNPLSADASDMFEVDTSAPQVADVTLVNDNGPFNDDEITSDDTPSIDITFSQPVFGDAGDISVTGASVGAVSPSSITGFGTGTLTISFDTPLADDTYTITLDGSAGGLVNENNLPLANGNETIDFTIETTAPTADIINVTPDPRNTGVGSVDIDFSETIFDFTVDDLALSRDGNPVSLAGATLTENSPGSYTLSGISANTSAEGEYVLTLAAATSGITDLAGNLLAANASDTFVVDTTRPEATIAPVSPDPRDTAVSEIAVAFNEDVTGVDLADFTLTRNGNSVSLAGVSVVQDTASSYRITGLGGVTGGDGDYVITLASSGTGIADAAGNVAVGDSDTFNVDTTGPTVVSFTPSSTSSTPIDTIQFSLDDVNDIDAASAIATGNYQLLAANGDGEFANNSTDIRNFISSISFNATGNVVTIQLNPSLGAGLVQEIEDFRLIISPNVADELGNQLNDGSQEVIDFRVDTTIPIVTINSQTITDNTPTITGTIDDNDSTIVVTVNGQQYNAVNNQDGTWSVDGSVVGFVPDGVYDVSVLATDNLGKTGTDQTTDELTITDIYEPDGSTELADVRPVGPLPTDGTAEEHSLHNASDVDFVPFTIDAQDLFVISLEAEAGDQVRLGLYNSAGNLVVNIVDTNASGVAEIERTLAAGDYYLGVFSLTQDTVSSYTVSVASLPDLTIEVDEIVGNPSLYFGGEGTAEVEISNERGREAGGSVQVQIFVSTDSVFDGGDTLVGTGNVGLGTLAPGQSTFGSVDFSLPEGSSGGEYFFFASVDTANAIPEIDENNNDSDAFSQTVGEVVATFGGRDIARVTDADGTNITVRMPGGGSGIIVDNGFGELDIVVDGSTERSALIITNDRAGDGEADFDDIIVDNGLRVLNGPRLAVSGDVSIGGDAALVNILKAENSTISISGDVGQFLLGSGDNTNLFTGGDIRVLRAGEWIDGDIELQSLGTLVVVPQARDVFNRGFNVDLDVDDLGRAVIRTDIFDSDWYISDDAGPISALNASNWSLEVDGDLHSLVMRQAADVDLQADDVNVIRATNWERSNIDVDTLRTLLVTGNFSGDLEVDGPASGNLPALNVINIFGDVDNAEFDLDSVNVILVRGDVTNLDAFIDEGDVRLIRTGVLTNSDILLDDGGLWNGVFTQVNNSLVSASWAMALRATGDRFNAGDWSGEIDLGRNSDGLATRVLLTRGTFMAEYRATGDLLVASLGATDGASIFLGAAGSGNVLPDSAGDFFREATLRSLNVRGNAPGNNGPAFIDTNIAAWNIGTARLHSVETDNGGDPFGFTTSNAGLIDRLDDGLLRNADDSSDPLINLFADGDFVVRIVDGSIDT